MSHTVYEERPPPSPPRSASSLPLELEPEPAEDRAAAESQAEEDPPVHDKHNDNDGDNDSLDAEVEAEEQQRRLLDRTAAGGSGTALPSGRPSPSPPPTRRDVRHYLAKALYAAARLLRREEGGPSTSSSSPLPRVGNLVVFAPQTWRRTGWGVLGPHWFGPPIILLLDAFSGAYFVQEGWDRVGPLTAAVCAVMAFLTAYLLFDAAYRDPGAVASPRYAAFQRRAADEAAEAEAAAAEEVQAAAKAARTPRQANPFAFADADLRPTTRRSRGRTIPRWCDTCRAYQPADGGAAHCYDCGVCVAGYDHHCVWMGTCVGQDNHRQFVRFNLSWLAFLTYALLWVNWWGPKLASAASVSDR